MFVPKVETAKSFNQPGVRSMKVSPTASSGLEVGATTRAAASATATVTAARREAGEAGGGPVAGPGPGARPGRVVCAGLVVVTRGIRADAPVDGREPL